MRLLGYHDAYLGFLASQVARAPKQGSVLDVGCGSGAVSDAWAAIHGSDQAVTLLDPASEMLARAEASLVRRGVAPALQQSTLEDYAAKGSQSCILAAHVIEHVPDPAELLRELRKHAAPGGQLWLVVSKPHWCNAIVWLQWRHRSYARGAVAGFLQESGWDLAAEYAFPSGPPSRTSRGYLARAA